MIPSERLIEILKEKTGFPEFSSELKVIVQYLDEEYARTEQNHCDCHACPSKPHRLNKPLNPTTHD